MIKLLIVSPIPWDATSFYRSSGVLHNLARKVDLTFDQYAGRRFTWAELGAYDIVFFQRPASQDHLKLAEYAKSLGSKIWIDYDDNLFALPFESRAYFEYDNNIRANMLRMLLLADAVSVSTENLKEFFMAMKIDGEKIDVIPNALNTDFKQLTPAESFNADSPVIVWRGSETHWFDVECFSGALYEAIKESSDQWHFLGWPPATLMYQQDIAQKIVAHKGEDVIVYNEKLKMLKPRIMHVPLVENSLNKAKSNIAWIEATCAGAVTIAPNWPEWQRPGVICYDTPEEFCSLLKNPSQDYAKCWRESMDYIKENLLLDKVNEKRAEIVNTLVGRVYGNANFSMAIPGLNTLKESQTE